MMQIIIIIIIITKLKHEFIIIHFVNVETDLRHYGSNNYL
jgi:hypothetical protein